MTVEEAIQAATGGDTECMFQLGNYYATQEKKYDEAQEWYLNGAKAVVWHWRLPWVRS